MSTGKANENKEQIIILYASSVFHQVDKLFNEEKKKKDINRIEFHKTTQNNPKIDLLGIPTHVNSNFQA